MNKKNLMIITHDLAIGGLQKVVVNLCRNINKEEFNVSVLCLRDLGDFAKDVEELGIPVIFFPPPAGIKKYFPFFQIAKIFKKYKIDIIHTHNTQPLIDGTISALIAGVKTIVHTDHARSFPDKKRYMFLEWMASHFVFRMVGVSEHTSKNLMKYEHIPAKKIRTIINGVDENEFIIHENAGEIRREFGLTDESVIGLGVRFTEQKGIVYLIRALPEIIKHVPNIKLILVGEGPLKELYIYEANRLQVSDHIIMPGSRKDMGRILKILDLYVLPSLWEGLPMVILEAMAAGTPVLATNVGGNYTAIQDGVNGRLIESKNSVILAKEVINLIKSKQLLNKFSRQGKRIFREKFSASIMARRYERLYLRKELDI